MRFLLPVFLFVFQELFFPLLHPCPKERELASIFRDEWMDLMRLFRLRCGLDSRLLVAVMRPIFSEIEDTYVSILLVMVKGGA